MSKKSSFKELINSELPILVDFTASWCGPCKAMAPILVNVKKKVGESAKIVKVDIDQNQQFANNMGVSGVPTFVIFKEGEEKWRHVGMMSESQMIEVLDQFKKG